MRYPLVAFLLGVALACGADDDAGESPEVCSEIADMGECLDGELPCFWDDGVSECYPDCEPYEDEESCLAAGCLFTQEDGCALAVGF